MVLDDGSRHHDVDTGMVDGVWRERECVIQWGAGGRHEGDRGVDWRMKGETEDVVGVGKLGQDERRVS